MLSDFNNHFDGTLRQLFFFEETRTAKIYLTIRNCCGCQVLLREWLHLVRVINTSKCKRIFVTYVFTHFIKKIKISLFFCTQIVCNTVSTVDGLAVKTSL